MCVCVHSCSSWENMLESRNPDNWGNVEICSVSLPTLLPLVFEKRQKEEETSAIKVLD